MYPNITDQFYPSEEVIQTLKNEKRFERTARKPVRDCLLRYKTFLDAVDIYTGKIEEEIYQTAEQRARDALTPSTLDALRGKIETDPPQLQDGLRAHHLSLFFGLFYAPSNAFRVLIAHIKKEEYSPDSLILFGIYATEGMLRDRVMYDYLRARNIPLTPEDQKKYLELLGYFGRDYEFTGSFIASYGLFIRDALQINDEALIPLTSGNDRICKATCPIHQHCGELTAVDIRIINSARQLKDKWPSAIYIDDEKVYISARSLKAAESERISPLLDILWRAD